ncbi:MAG: right-handed parallel beta-helix repeat-containing protein [Porphyromonadaceae bacterium]|nr:MAG: right-handed parallel beta-helix repeat-containing protein [Porphyromonadaceae bacterium]
MKFKYLIFTGTLLLVLFFSCRKNDPIVNPDAKLEFSTDTVLFDTIFTTIGSTTKNFRVYNKHAQPITIDRIILAGNQGSRFRLNINGKLTNELEKIEILAKDSMYIFVEVTLNPTNQNNPMVVQDSVVFQTNGNTQDVDLIAFGQDVHLVNGEILKTQTWINDKPYLVYNSMLVDSLQTLTIEPGTRIHFHKRSSMLVKGTLLVNGTLEEPVSFLGDRLEHQYDEYPGQWGSWMEYENGSVYILGGIHFLNGSKDNMIRYAVIKNAMKGIQADTLANPSKPTLTISDTRIENMSVAGIYAQSSTILASNCLIANCGSWCVALTLGGSYEFYHCTISNNSNFGVGNRTEPALMLNNFFVYEGTAYVYNLYNALFANCIITGSRPMEIEFINTINKKPVPGQFNYIFDHCLVTIDTMNTSDESKWIDVVKNLYPRFDSLTFTVRDYRLDTLSPAKDRANPVFSKLFPLDLIGISRLSDAGPDIGAYERQDK